MKAYQVLIVEYTPKKTDSWCISYVNQQDRNTKWSIYYANNEGHLRRMLNLMGLTYDEHSIKEFK